MRQHLPPPTARGEGQAAGKPLRRAPPPRTSTDVVQGAPQLPARPGALLSLSRACAALAACPSCSLQRALASAEKFAPARHVVRHDGRAVYEWDQTLEEVNAYVPAPPGVRACHLQCQFASTAVRLGLVGNPPYMQGELPHAVKTSECFWTLEDGSIHITLQKMEPGKTWECFLVGHAALDALTGEADRKRILLERFQAETPGFDFSGAELSGAARDASTFMR